MPCVSPLQGWKGRATTKLGKRPVVFSHSEAFADMPVNLPCGQCIGCRLDRARMWSVRCYHEAQLWQDNAFVTLTYAPENIPVVNGIATLRPRDFVLFMKRLRLERPGVRFFQCGEYGSLGRPHHHALLFNCGFPDAVKWSGEGGRILYRSAFLESMWVHGFSSIGAVSVESAGYVARYTLKKVTGPEATKYYDGRVPDYLTMSRRPGIGSAWFDKFKSDVFPSDGVVLQGGVRVKSPRYYDDKLAREDPELLASLKAKRACLVKDSENRSGRFYAKQEVMRARVKLFSRGGLE